ncbi:hypothetical protein RhiirA1_483139 [Rhizophagus irregularis]|uniref:Uncharacterized protein n=1 Tax=Rhizophagus irregularis TaxID=588596 RepID=A0A2N0QKZ0_9GLOM|nr:hypothetical protein RhiirA1_483139 [Rhizophagus irregularis]
MKLTENRIKCTTLVDTHNHELNPIQIAHLNARYQHFNDEMMQDLKFFTDCKDIYNLIYRLYKNKNEENSDTSSLLNNFLEKIIQDSGWKFRHLKLKDEMPKFNIP